jgi:hypothetical protein
MRAILDNIFLSSLAILFLGFLLPMMDDWMGFDWDLVGGVLIVGVLVTGVLSVIVMIWVR